MVLAFLCAFAGGSEDDDWRRNHQLLRISSREHPAQIPQLTPWLSHLKEAGQIEAWRLLRRKLGLAFEPLGEFQILIETRDLAQLDEAFKFAASRSKPTEAAHAAVNQLVVNFHAALYRDFPDPNRRFGEETF